MRARAADSMRPRDGSGISPCAWLLRAACAAWCACAGRAKCLRVVPGQEPQPERRHEPIASRLLTRDWSERARLTDGMPRSPAMRSRRPALSGVPSAASTRLRFRQSRLNESHGRAPLRRALDSGATVPDFSRSPLPTNPLFTMQPASLPRRRMKRRATRWMITSPSSMLKFRSDSDTIVVQDEDRRLLGLGGEREPRVHAVIGGRDGLERRIPAEPVVDVPRPVRVERAELALAARRVLLRMRGGYVKRTAYMTSSRRIRALGAGRVVELVACAGW